LIRTGVSFAREPSVEAGLFSVSHLDPTIRTGSTIQIQINPHFWQSRPEVGHPDILASDASKGPST